MNEKFGEYNLLRLLGEGQSTAVYLAEHPANGRVALKSTVEAFSQDWSNSFLNGVRKAASLSHPNITQIHDWGTVDGRVFEVSDFILGRDLKKVAERGFDEGRFFPVPLAVSVIASAAGGLYYAHSRRDSEGEQAPVFHEDLCPQNVILGADGNVKLTDFAVGEALRELSPVPGRLAYLSPEQIDVDYGPIDARTDVFSLGVVAYELITCKRLFKGETDKDTFEKVLTLPIMPPHHLRAEVDEKLSNIIMKALEREPTLRFQTVRDFQMSLVDWLSSQDNHTTDAHLSAYLNSLFPELEGEKLPEETNALVISASLFEQMDASSGVNFEKWAEEQSLGQVAEMSEETLITRTKEELLESSPPEIAPDPDRVTKFGLPTTAPSEPESEPQQDEESISSVLAPSAASEPELAPPAAASEPEKVEKINTKKKIALADLPMPSLSLAQSSSIMSSAPPTAAPETDDPSFMSDVTVQMDAPVISVDVTGDFEVPPTRITEARAPDLEVQADQPDPDATLIQDAVSVELGAIEESEVAPAVAPAVVVEQAVAEAEPDSNDIQKVGPGGFRPPALTPSGSTSIAAPEPAFDDPEIEDWKPTSNKKGILIGLVAVVVLAIFGTGIYFATNTESTLEKDVGGKKIDPSKIKELVVAPPPATVLLTVNSKNENIRYIVNGKLKEQTDGTIPIFKGVTNEIIAMAPGHVPKMEMVAGEAGVAPVEFELTQMELEQDSELQIMTDPRGANVIVDGIPVGTSPTTVKLSSRIEHHVEISASGRRPHAAFIGLIPGKNNLIDAQLEADKRSYVGVNFGALPRGSSIKLDGKPLGMSPTFKKLKRNRIMRVDISQADSFPSTRRLSLVDLGSFEMRPFLRKISRKKGTISLKVIPKGGEIYIGANGYGLGPIKKLKLAEGSKRVVIDSAAGRIEKTLEVLPDKHVAYTLKINGSKATLTKKIRNK